MIERIGDMPPGTFGFRASGRPDKAECIDVIVPALKDASRGGEPVRVLFQLDTELSGREATALWEEIKEDLDPEHRRAANWERVALVTDQGWIKRAVGLFGWMSKGDMKVFAPDRMDRARKWVEG